MKELLKNKLFLALLIGIFYILISNSNSFANNSITFNAKQFNNKEVTVILPDTSNFPYYYCNKNSSWYYFYFSDQPFIINDRDKEIYPSHNPIGVIGYYWEARDDKSLPDLLDFSSIDFLSVPIGTTVDISLPNDPTLCRIERNNYGGMGVKAYTINLIDYGNHDICNSSTNEVVFQGAPQAQEGAVQVELMKPTQVQEIPQQILAVVMIVLPIFLGIFGVLLVLYLIKSKNLLQL